LETASAAATIMKLMTMAEAQAARRGKALQKGRSRLEETASARTLQLIDDKAFKSEVRARDQYHCRKCLRAVKVVIARVPERAEVHHVHGRHGDLRFDSRAALLLCLTCHEQVTGRVSERWIIVPTKTFSIASMPSREFCDARAPVQFERVA
jgi:hypothetical protein